MIAGDNCECYGYGRLLCEYGKRDKVALDGVIMWVTNVVWRGWLCAQGESNGCECKAFQLPYGLCKDCNLSW